MTGNRFVNLSNSENFLERLLAADNCDLVAGRLEEETIIGIRYLMSDASACHTLPPLFCVFCVFVFRLIFCVCVSVSLYESLKSHVKSETGF